MKIIVINGQGGVGKDTFIGFCGNEDKGIYSVSMIDGVRKIAKSIGWSGQKQLIDRKFLSDLKDLLSDYNDFPFQDTLKRIQEIEKKYNRYGDMPNELICFIHAREPKDIKRWVDDYGAKTLLIRRPSIEGNYGNHADDNVFDIEYDYVCMNDDGMEHLRSEAYIFMEELRLEKWESNINGKDN